MIEGITYRRVAVYDIGDTYVKKGNKKIPILDDVIDADTTKDLYNKLIKISPIPVLVEEINGIKKGYYSKEKNIIVIKKDYHKMTRQQHYYMNYVIVYMMILIIAKKEKRVKYL